MHDVQEKPSKSPLADALGGRTAALIAAYRAIEATLKPPPRLSMSEWAETYGVLSRQTSATPGRFTPFAYQRGILDAFTDPTVTRVVVKKSARIGWTRIMDMVAGYFVHQDPSPILLVQPRVEDAQDYSESEIKPMLIDTPVLREIMGEVKEKDSDQKILKRNFRNGASMRFVGANSPGGFRRITVRIVLFDEVDGYPEGAGEEGDQIALGIKRTETFWNRKIGIGSTPTTKGRSRIEKAYAESDMRRYYVPCPHCGHMQTLRWENLRWDRAEEGVPLHPVYGNHLPATAHFVCEANGCIVDESDKYDMVEHGEWRGEKQFEGIAGFHIWAGYSLFPNAAWRYLVEEFLRVRKDPTLLRTFVNLVLGEEWEEPAEKVDSSSLVNRGENYGPESIPAGVVFLTCGVDVQGDRLEATVYGWGAREESYAVEHEVFLGDPAQGHVWNLLDEFLRRARHGEVLSSAGNVQRELRIRATCIDTGGHHANQVFAFAKARRARHVYPIKGAAGPRPVWPKHASRTGADQVMYLVGVDTAKDAIYGRLRIDKPGPGYIHFPADGAFDQEFFDQLTSERVVTRKKKQGNDKGRSYRVWEPMRPRNEALDCAVYALAARMSLPIRLDAFRPPTPPPRPADPMDIESGPVNDSARRDELSATTAAHAGPPSPPPPSGVRHSAFIKDRRRGWFDRGR